MTALRLTNTSPAADDTTTSEWLSVTEVARRLEVSGRRVRQRCVDQWQPMMLARQEDGQWFVHVDADPRLAAAPPQSDLLIRSDFTSMPETQQKAAMQRSECVRRFRAAKADRQDAVAVWLPALLVELNKDYPGFQGKITRSTLYRWDKRSGHPIDVAELVDWRGHANRERDGMGCPQAWEYFAEQYLDGNEPSLADCWRRTRMWADERGLDWCSVHSCKRQLDNRISKEQQMRYRRPAVWRSQYATFIEQDDERHAAGDCWVSDHRPLDLMVLHNGKPVRPVITIWHDWRTRKVVGWELSVNPNTDSILAAFGMAVRNPLNLGPPLLVWMDNGKDFDSVALNGRSKKERQAAKRWRDKARVDETWFGGVFGALGIESHFSIPHTPQGKPRCERWFATMASQFDKCWATYTGKDTTRKPEGLAGRIGKKSRVIPTFKQVRDHVEDFVNAYNKNHDHAMDDLRDPQSQLKLSPNEAYAALTTPRMMADPAALDLCLMPHTKPVKVGRQGVRVQLPGCPARYYGQYEPALRPYKGTKRKVYVAYDPADTRRVQVRDEKIGLICIAALNSTTGVYGSPQSREAMQRAMRAKSAYNEGLKQTRKHQRAAYLNTDYLIAQKAAEIEAEDAADTRIEPDPDRPMRLIQTPFDGQSKEVRRHEHRQAAGAEGQGSVDAMIDVTKLLSARPKAAAPQPAERIADPVGLVGRGRSADQPVGDPALAEEVIDPMALFISKTRGSGGGGDAGEEVAT